MKILSEIGILTAPFQVVYIIKVYFLIVLFG